MENKFIKKIAIVGGGTAGWIAAAALAKTLHDKNVEIVLVESAEFDIIGVGEATIPPIVNFLKYLEVDEAEFMRATQATYKLGIKFCDWNTPGDAYWHPFGRVGVNIENHDFFALLQKARVNGDSSEMWQYSPSAVMGEAGRFYSPSAASEDSFMAGASYALHFDAQKVARFLRRYCEKHGVTRVEDTVTDVTLHDNGFIDELVLKDNPRLKADFFFDCSGNNAVLIGGALNTPYIDWNSLLLCNSAVTVQCESTGDMPPYTQMVARENGWTWEIPLQHRTGNGYVYNKDIFSGEQAEAFLLNKLQGKPLSQPRHFQFKPGRREKLWNNNCVALGFTAGFLEPLESTAIYLSTRGIENFLALYPDRHCDPALAQEFNRRFAEDYQNIRDFILLHYYLSDRQDTDFWKQVKAVELPETLATKIALYKAQGRIFSNPADLFEPQSWHAVFDGMGTVPECYNPLVDSANLDEVTKILTQVRELMAKMANGLPKHAEFIANHCRAIKN